jgi:hypothetical protein
VDGKIARYLYNGKLPKRVKGNRADAYCKAIPQPKPQSAATAGQSQAQSVEQPTALQQLRLEQQKIAVRR